MATGGNLRSDIWDYWQHAQRHYVNLVAGVVMALLAFVSSATGLVVPARVFWILATAFLVVAQFRTYRDVRRDLSKLQASVDELMARRKRLLTSREITEETLNIWELIQDDHKPLVEGRTFTECTFIGPAVVGFIGNTTVTDFQLGEGEVNSILHEMVSPGVKQGIVAFLNCKLLHCKFRGIGIFGDKATLDKIRQSTVVI